MFRRTGATSCAPNPRRARRATDGSACDPREQTGRGSPAGRGSSKWQPKPDAGFLWHENTTSLPSVFGPGSRQHVRHQQSNGAESRGRRGVSAEALPYRQTAGGSCRGKNGKRAAFNPNGSEHVVVQPRAAGNHWKVVGSSVGSLDEDEWRCHGRWFLRCCEDNGVCIRFVSPRGAIALSCR